MKIVKKLTVATLTASLLFTPLLPASQANAEVIWNNAEIVKGQIGIVTALKDTYLYSLDNDQLITARTVKKGERLRVYSTLNQHGGLYAVGANLYAQTSPSITYEKIPSDKIQALGINVTKETINSSISYPKVSNLFNKQLERSINNHFQTLGAEGKKYYDSLKAQEQEDQYNGHYFGPYEFEMTHSVSYNQDNRLSIAMTYYEYTGGAHGLSYIETFNYDLLKARELHLKDVITTKTQLAKVNKYIKSMMVNRNKAGAMYWVENFKSVDLMDDSFYFTKDGIMIIFQLYQYAPYANGFGYFNVPYKVFK